MSELAILLVVVSAGISAYLRARAEGTWSWRLFARTMLGAALLVAVVVGAGIWLGTVLGRDYVGLVVGLDLLLIGVGVTALAWWARPRPGGKAR